MHKSLVLVALLGLLALALAQTPKAKHAGAKHGHKKHHHHKSTTVAASPAPVAKRSAEQEGGSASSEQADDGQFSIQIVKKRQAVPEEVRRLTWLLGDF